MEDKSIAPFTAIVRRRVKQVFPISPGTWASHLGERYANFREFWISSPIDKTYCSEYYRADACPQEEELLITAKVQVLMKGLGVLSVAGRVEGKKKLRPTLDETQAK